MNKTFEQEWNLYKAGGKRPSFAGEAPRGDAEFDSPVKVGEIRIFADMARPFVALVAEDRGNAGFFIVPVSPFTVPASSRELLEGERVYQLWNACTAARSFVERSWLVEEIDADTLATVRGKCAANFEFAAEGAVAEYEREFLISGGDFIPLVNKEIPRIVHVSWRRVLGVAACFVILLGLGVVTLMHDQQEQEWVIRMSGWWMSPLSKMIRLQRRLLRHLPSSTKKREWVSNTLASFLPSANSMARSKNARMSLLQILPMRRRVALDLRLSVSVKL